MPQKVADIFEFRTAAHFSDFDMSFKSALLIWMFLIRKMFWNRGYEIAHVSFKLNLINFGTSIKLECLALFVTCYVVCSIIFRAEVKKFGRFEVKENREIFIVRLFIIKNQFGPGDVYS